VDEDALEDFIVVKQRSPMEKADLLRDRWPLLDVRKALMRIWYAFQQLCELTYQHRYFQAFIIACILLNTVLLALEDPSLTIQPEPYQTMELSLLYIYTAEMIIKVIPMGFVFSKGTYLRDNWNKMDCLVVITGWIEVYSKGSTINMSALRALRVLRPLRSITRIRGMKIILLSLIRSTRALMSSLALLLFFYLITSIAALQMFMGVLKYRCLDLDTGYLDPAWEDSNTCGAHLCDSGLVCVKGLDNINHGKTNFDNVLMAMLTIFQSVTLEGWTDVMVGLERTFSMFSVVFYIPVVFLGAFFFNNMLLISMKSAVSPKQFTATLLAENEKMKKKKANPNLKYTEESEILESSQPSESLKLPNSHLMDEFGYPLLTNSADMEGAAKDPAETNSHTGNKYAKKRSTRIKSEMKLLSSRDFCEEVPAVATQMWRKEADPFGLAQGSYARDDLGAGTTAVSSEHPNSMQITSQVEDQTLQHEAMTPTIAFQLSQAPFVLKQIDQKQLVKKAYLTFGLTEKYPITMSSREDILGLKISIHSENLPKQPKFYYIRTTETSESAASCPDQLSGEDISRFSRFQTLSLRYTSKEAYMQVLPSALQLVQSRFVFPI
jgi:hypothetical protein